MRILILFRNNNLFLRIVRTKTKENIFIIWFMFPFYHLLNNVNMLLIYMAAGPGTYLNSPHPDSIGSFNKTTQWISHKYGGLIAFFGLQCCLKLTLHFNDTPKIIKSRLLCILERTNFPFLLAICTMRCPH